MKDQQPMTEKAKAGKLAYMAARREQTREYLKQWRRNNPDKVRQHQINFFERMADKLNQ